VNQSDSAPRRRGNREGSVRQRPGGRWEARYSYVDQGGQLHRRSLYGTTEPEARRKLRAALRAIDDGTLATAKPSDTVGAYLAEWHASIRGTVRPSTWQRYGDHVRLHLTPTLGRVKLTALTPSQCQRAYAALLDRGLAPGTVKRAHATLRRALNQAVRWRVLAVNPAAMAEPPRLVRRDMTTLDAAQARALLDAASDDRLEALWVLALTTGMRRGELLALRWRDVDLDAGYLTVTGTVARAPGEGMVRAEPKTARSRRRVELSRAAVVALRRRHALSIEERFAAANLWQDRDVVLSTVLGGYLDFTSLAEAFRELLARADLPPIRFHDLRHTAATLMLARGVHPKIASEMLGHSTVAITLDLYSHVSPSMQQQAAAAMDSVLSGEGA
jgi:integrase